MNDHIYLMIEELKKVINFYVSSASGEERIQRCFITGGNILLPGMSKSLEELVAVEVETLDPFGRFKFNEKTIDEENLDSIRQFSLTALGLGMRTE